MAGISSFGFSGTNGHLIVEDVEDLRSPLPPLIRGVRDSAGGFNPDPRGVRDSAGGFNPDPSAFGISLIKTPDPSAFGISLIKGDKGGELARDRKLHLLALSAKSEQALKDLVKQYQNYLSSPASTALNIKDICYTASAKRSHFEHRLAIIARNTEELKQQLVRALAVTPQKATSHNNKIAFLFTGQGSQYIDMGRELYETQPVFKQNCDRCFQILKQYLNTPLKEILFSDSPLLSPEDREMPKAEGSGLNPPALSRTPLIKGGRGDRLPPLNQTQYTQPAIFTIEYALAQMWMSWGIKPDVVTGHSIGEFVAATIAGVFSLEDAIKLVTNRGKLMQELAPNGKMYVIQANEEQVNNVIKTESGISIAAINTQDNIVISGSTKVIDKAIAIFNDQEIKTTQLQVSHAFHSPLMESILPAFRKVAESVIYSPPQITFVSNVTGERISDSIATPQYWIEHICKPVRFAAGMKTLAELKCNIFFEIGAKPILLGMARIQPPFLRGDRGGIEGGLWLPSLRYGQSDWQSILSSVASLYTHNINLDWNSFYRDKGQILPLPTYPFQGQEYWLSGNNKKYNVGAFRETPLLGNEIKLAKGNRRIWQNKISINNPEYLIDHQVKQQVVFPSAGYIEMALRAGKEVLNYDSLELTNIDFQQRLILSKSITEIQFVLDAEVDRDSHNFEIFSLDNNSKWVCNSQGKIGKAFIESSNYNLTQYRQEINRKVDLDKYYQDLASRGLEYGNSFKAIAELYHLDNQALGKIELPANLVPDTGNYVIHPALLDACLQVGGAAIDDDSSQIYLPIAIEKIAFNINKSSLNTVWSCAKLVNYSSGIYTLDFELTSEQEKIAVITGVKIKATKANLLNRKNANIDDWLYQIEWRDLPLDSKKDNSFISLIDIQQKANIKFSQLTNNAEFNNYLRLLSELENISVHYIVDALIKLGVDLKLGQLLNLSVEEFRILEKHQQLWSRILNILNEAEILKQINGIWQVIKVPEIVNIDKQQQQLLEQYPQAKTELDLLHRCASQLDKVLTGNIAPKELLFPGGDLSSTASLYQDSSGAKVTNTVVVEAIKEASIARPRNIKTKILEIGAGTGGTTAYILPELTSYNTEYTFSDLSSLFLAKAKAKFKQYDFVKYELLDISKAPQNNETYDIIIAANVLHATTDLKQTLNNIRQLLNPEGLLILVEGTQPIRWFDLTFGMTEGWWKFADKQLRANYPLLSANKWQQILLETDFTVATHHGTSLPQAVIIARLSKKNIDRQHYLIFADKQGIGTELSNYLAICDRNYILVTSGTEFKQISPNNYQINPLYYNNYTRLIQSIQQQEIKLDHIIYLQSLDSDRHNLETNITNNSNAVLYLTNALVRNNLTKTNLYLVTSAVDLEQEISIEGLSQSSLHGFSKVINLEHPELNCCCINLDPVADFKQQVESLITEIESDSKGEQIVWHDGKRKVARLTRYQPEKKLLIPEDKPYQLSISKKGTPKNLQLVPLQRRQPLANEVEIEVKATGLNFIDILDALGLLPFVKDWFGVECTGEIVAVGKDVTNFAIADKVIALSTGSFNKYVTVDRLMVVNKPDNLNWEEAVTIPANFLTASYALETTVSAGQIDSEGNLQRQPLANAIRPDLQSKILIHSAAGGTGMAAVQIAQLAGMEIFATASPNKWEFLHSLGIKQVMNSRNLDFANEIMQLTNDEGVDIVFNSLSGEFIDRSLSVLKDNGHFIEIGKRNIWSKEKVAKVKPNVAYSQIDLFSAARQQPAVIQSLLAKLIDRFATGELKPLPYKTFAIENTISAFQYMQQAKHIGKVIVTHDHPVSANGSSLPIHNHKTYLIAGGLGDLGLLTANWLVEKGAKYLILIGRSKPSEYARQQIDKLEQQNITVKVIQADIADYNSLSRAIKQSPLPEIAGVIHSAGVLDDGMLVNLDADRMKTVMNPKVLGAWNLHQLTKDIQLNFFILFSSAASLLGSPGQTNHVVANTFLDTLAHYRQAYNLPALSLNWGAWSNIGAAAKRQVDRDMNLKGIGAISPQAGLEILEKLITQSSPQVGIIPIDWTRFITAGYNLPLIEDFKQRKQNE